MNESIADLAAAEAGGDGLEEPPAIGRRQRLGRGHDGGHLFVGESDRGWHQRQTML